MSVAEAARREKSVPTALKGEERFTLYDVSWEFYEALLAELGDHTSVRVTYDHGKLELMSPFFRHEKYGGILALLIRVAAEELDLPIIGGGSTTFRRKDLKRGLEPDECFYIANVERIKNKLEIDLSRDPPPDLAIEIDITTSSLDRMGIYAALGIPEIWRFDGQVLRIYERRSNHKYEECSCSPSFSLVPVADIVRFIRFDGTALAKRFRQWVRENVASRSEAKKKRRER